MIETLRLKGIRDVVLSPGSRNAPLAVGFKRDPHFRCEVIHDERSAAYHALGISLATGGASVLVCTSGTAVLNYAPAVAEAYYQRISLIVLTADRPEAWIDQLDGQTVRQTGVYANHVRGFFDFRCDVEQPDEMHHELRKMNQAVHLATGAVPGPVHLNVRLAEPLYEFGDFPDEKIFRFDRIESDYGISPADLEPLKRIWGSVRKKMIVVGQHPAEPKLIEVLADYAGCGDVVILRDLLANLPSDCGIQHFDPAIVSFSEEEKETATPDLVIYLGGQIVSKVVKKFLRRVRPVHQWRVDPSGEAVDLFQCLSLNLVAFPVALLENLSAGGLTGKAVSSEGQEFRRLWTERERDFVRRASVPFDGKRLTDLEVFRLLAETLEPSWNLHLANSMPVRYAQCFRFEGNHRYFGNRGTSGIDGCVSVAVGTATASAAKTLLIVGDTAFFYDSNALWRDKPPGNLRILLLNNGGGGIFRILDEAEKMPEREALLEATHARNARSICDEFKVRRFAVRDAETLKLRLEYLLGNACESCTLVEAFTEPALNRQAFKHLFRISGE